MKNKVSLFLLLACMVLSFIMTSAAERINLINDNTDILQMNDATFENGVFTMTDSSKAYLSSFSVPNLTDDYVWSGDIKILEFGEDRGPNGVRFCVGYDSDSGNYLNLIVTKNIGIAAEKRGPNPQSDVYKLTKEHYDKAIDAGSEFHFEITRKGSHIVMKIDDITAMDYEFPAEFSYFTEGDAYNLGFHAEKCSFEVRNLTVYCDNVVITPEPTQTPELTETPVPTDTPEVTQNTIVTKKPEATNKPVDDKGLKVDPIIIGAVVCVGVLVAITAVVLIKRKKSS